MNRKYLGDALDHFKGAVLRHLQDTGDLRDLAVDPMVTDPEHWNEAEYLLYARLISVGRDRVVPNGGILNPRTRRHLGLPNHDGDVFLDPDTGIKTGTQYPLRCFVQPHEIVSLLEDCGVVAVYQHAWRVGELGWVTTVWKAVMAQMRDIWGTAYASKQVALLFFSENGRRIAALDRSLRTWLAPAVEHVVSLRIPGQE